jgi:Mn2+/Fe2+ NRAMP family transporter
MTTSTTRTFRPVRRRRLLVVLAVFGPGLLAGLSDDDPAGITTYSVLGAEYGYQLLWVLLLATAALVVFHDLAARMGVVTGQGLIGLVRQRHGMRPAAAACSSPTSRPGSRPAPSGTRRSAASSCRRCRPRTARS